MKKLLICRKPLAVFVFLVFVFLFRITYFSFCNAPSPKISASFQNFGEVSCLAFSPDGKYLVSGSKGVSDQPNGFWQGDVIVWELPTKKKVASHRLGSWVQSLALSPNGNLLAVGTGVNWNGAQDFLGFVQQPGEISIYEFPSLKKRGKVLEGSGVLWVRFAVDGKTLASSSFTSVGLAKGFVPGEVLLWDLPSLKFKRKVEHLNNWDPPIALSPDGKTLAVGEGPPHGQGNLKGSVKLFSINTIEKVSEFSVKDESVKYVEFSPDGKTLAVMTYRGEAVTLWDVQTGKDVTPLKFTDVFNWNRQSRFSPDGKLLAATCNKGGSSPTGQSWIVIWDFVAEKEKMKIVWPEKRVLLPSLAFSPNSDSLAVGTNGGAVKIFNLE